MTYIIIITFCIIILLSYIFDYTSKITKIPSVVLLLILGVLINQIVKYFNFHIPDLKQLLPILGTIGIVLIVLEGVLELEITREKRKVIFETILSAAVLLVLTSVIFAAIANQLYNLPFNTCMLNMIPLGIISSAIAIPSVQGLIKEKREFVIYESSLSDIFGIILFNFFIFKESYGAKDISNFFFSIILFLIISVAASFFLSFLIRKINHHIKYIPIIIVLILIYAIGEVYHLPALILILIFGLFINNVINIKNPKIIKLIKPEAINEELKPFKLLTGEISFIIRSFFFLMFGFYTDLNALINIDNLFISLLILAFLLITRYLFLKLLIKKTSPFLFIIPRGLITILLFLKIPEGLKIPVINEGVLTQLIFLSVIIMFVGLIKFKENKT